MIASFPWLILGTRGDEFQVYACALLGDKIICILALLKIMIVFLFYWGLGRGALEFDRPIGFNDNQSFG